MSHFAYYIHDLSPFALKLGENFGIRWYGLAYVIGFFAGIWLLKHFARKGQLRVPVAKVDNLIFFIALFGVVLGGRLGFFLLYDFDAFADNPLTFFHFHKGGMASHGGIAGIAVVAWFYARATRTSITNIGDHLVIAAPIGLFTGRLANFINGELWGKKSDVAWAVQFPEELHWINSGLPGDSTLQDLPASSPLYQSLNQILYATSGDGNEASTVIRPINEVVAIAKENPAVWQDLTTYLTPRHPSQIYEGLLEGLLLFIILFGVRHFFPKLRDGILTGLFFILYAVARVTGEMFRYPGDGIILGMSYGQFYSLFMVLIGAGFLAYAFSRKPTTRPGAT